MPFDVRLLYEPRALKIGRAVQYRWERRLYEPCQISHYMLDVSHHVAWLSSRALSGAIIAVADRLGCLPRKHRRAVRSRNERAQGRLRGLRGWLYLLVIIYQHVGGQGRSQEAIGDVSRVAKPYVCLPNALWDDVEVSLCLRPPPSCVLVQIASLTVSPSCLLSRLAM